MILKIGSKYTNQNLEIVIIICNDEWDKNIFIDNLGRLYHSNGKYYYGNSKYDLSELESDEIQFRNI